MTKRLLMIDDDVDFCELLSRGLKRQGYTVDIVHQANDIQDHLTVSYDVILCDLNLGHQSGMSLLPTLVTHKKKADIIILTGFASLSTAVEAIKLGASDYISKPITASELIQHIESPDTKEAIQQTSLDTKEWELIQETLAHFDYNVTKTAAHLGLSRRTLQRKLKKRQFYQ